MRCPRCGNEMVLDYHRKIPLNMCYNCGYIEGRSVDSDHVPISNYDFMHNLNIRETASFLSEWLLSKGVSLDSSEIEQWLQEEKP